MPLIVHAPSSAVALSSPAALVGSRDGIDVGVDVGRFVALGQHVYSESCIDGFGGDGK